MINLKKEKFEEKSKRANEIAEYLLKMYPRRKTVLTFSNAWECLVAVQLSAQCTDKRVNLVTPTLFKKYPKLEDYVKAGWNSDGSLNHSGIKKFEQEIYSTGFYRNKTKNILGSAQKVLNDFDGKVPQTMTELLTLPGVARKTANVILFNAFGVVEGVAVDTHVKRITNLLGLISKTSKDPVAIEKDLIKILPKKHWALFSLLITEHGREICIARKPKCKYCKFNHLCPSVRI